MGLVPRTRLLTGYNGGRWTLEGTPRPPLAAGARVLAWRSYGCHWLGLQLVSVGDREDAELVVDVGRGTAE